MNELSSYLCEDPSGMLRLKMMVYVLLFGLCVDDYICKTAAGARRLQSIGLQNASLYNSACFRSGVIICANSLKIN